MKALLVRLRLPPVLFCRILPGMAAILYHSRCEPEVSRAGCSLSSTLTLRERKLQTGGGGRGPTDRRDYGGGGGGGRGDGAPNYGERLRRCRLGVAIALVAIVTLFVVFTVAFLIRANLGIWDPATGMYVRDWLPLRLPLALLSINTALLLVSSVTLELARRQAAEVALLAPLRSIPGIATGPRRPIPWLAVSIGLGVFFLAGQMLAWHVLIASGVDVHSGTSGSFFYVLTGTHAVHLFGGLLVLVYAGLMLVLSKPAESRRLVVDVTAWYWHTMGVLWLYIFGLLVFCNKSSG